MLTLAMIYMLGPEVLLTIQNLKIASLLQYCCILKNRDKEKKVYCGYGIVFDGAGSWNFGNDLTRNVVIFAVDNSS